MKTKFIIEDWAGNILDKPLSKKKIKELSKNGKMYVTGKVSLDLNEIYDGHETFLDALSMHLVGNELLMDITYSVIGGKGKSVFFEVSGDVSEVLNSMED